MQLLPQPSAMKMSSLEFCLNISGRMYQKMYIDVPFDINYPVVI